MNVNKTFIIYKARELMDRHQELRYGQAVANIASSLFQEEVQKITGTDADCFYDSHKVDMFLDALSSLVNGKDENVGEVISWADMEKLAKAAASMKAGK